MYRFESIRDYDRRLEQLTALINWMKRSHADPHEIIDKELMRVSYILERKEFLRSNPLHF